MRDGGHVPFGCGGWLRVGVVGAGVAGLAAARALVAAGHEAVVFEKSGGLGGRCATRRVGPYTFDTGATSFVPRGSALEAALLHELDATDLVRVERPVYVHRGNRAAPGDPTRAQQARYVYRDGINRIGKLLAEGLDVRQGTLIEGLERPLDGGYVLGGEAFEAVVLAVPAPQAEPLLASVGEARALANARYRACVSVLFGFERPLDTPYHAAVCLDRNVPLTWLSVESVKVPGARAPEGHAAVVAQMSPEYSQRRYDAPDSLILGEVLADVRRLVGAGVGEPVVSDVKRWRYSQPETTASFESANPPGARLIVAGDGVLAGRADAAYETGLLAARRILAP